MAPKDDTSCKELQLRMQSKRLARIYYAGVNPQDFSRMARLQEVELLSVPSLCDEVLLCLVVPENKNARRLIAFGELCYIMAGILIVYRTQVNLLYDQVLRQTHFTMDFMRSTQSITMGKKPTIASFTKKRRSQKDDSIESIPTKRVKFFEVAEFDWHSLDVSEAEDDESTIEILQTSKVMNRDQISIREVISHPMADPLSQLNQFDASENGNTENFLKIRELVAHGRSIMHIIQNDNFTPIVAGDNRHHNDDDYEYAPLGPRTSSPLPYIDGCMEELDQYDEHPVDDLEMAVANDTADYGGTSNACASLPPQVSPQLPQIATMGRKRKRVSMDIVLQIPIVSDNWDTDKRQSRCSDPRSDCVTKGMLMREFKLKFFKQSAHAFKALHPRCVTDTVPVLLQLNGMKRTARKKEPNDLEMVQDFLNSIDRESENDEQDGLQLQDYQQQNDQQLDVDELQEDHFNRRSTRVGSTRSSIQDSSIDRPLPCNEILPQIIDPIEMDDFTHHDEPMYNSDSDVDMIAMEPEPFYELQPVAKSNPIRNRKQQEPDRYLPSINESPLNERQRSVIDSSQQRNYRLDSATVPPYILRLLNHFITVNASSEPCKLGSQELFALSSKKNKENWGLKGVLETLFRLWYNNNRPIGITDLIYPHTGKLVAALAFYSVIDLSSPRIGFVEIETNEGSNTIYNISMAPKLISLLQSVNVN